MRGRILSLHWICLAACLAVPAKGDDWSSWRGPNGDGVSSLDWPAEPGKVWQVDVGEGHAAPVVDGEKIFVHSRVANDEVVTALDAKSGKTLWRQTYTEPFRPEEIYGGHGVSPKATPATHGGRLFTMAISGRVKAWETDEGEELWTWDPAEHFKAPAPLWGTASSVLTDGDRVIVQAGGEGGGALVALDGATGKEVWRLADTGPAYSSPIITTLGGMRQIVAFNAAGILGVRSEDGQKLWSYPFAQTRYQQNVITPVVYDDRVFVSGEDRGTFALSVNVVDNDWKVEKSWTYDLILEMGSPVVHKGMLYGVASNDRGRPFCLDFATGEECWQGPPRSGNYASMVLAGDNLLILNERGELNVVTAQPESYAVQKTYKVSDSPTWAHLVPVANGFLVKDEKTLSLWR